MDKLQLYRLVNDSCFNIIKLSNRMNEKQIHSQKNDKDYQDDYQFVFDMPVRKQNLGPPGIKKRYKGIGPFMLEQKQVTKQSGEIAKTVSTAQLMMLYSQASKPFYRSKNMKMILNNLVKDSINEKQQHTFFTYLQQVDLFHMERINHVQMTLNCLKQVGLISKLFLVNLQILDLSRNNIQSIEPLSLCYFPYLSFLSLHNNRITRIDTLRSCNFIFLQTILLDNNYINQIGRVSDSVLPYLEYFQIYRNLLVDIPPLFKLYQYNVKVDRFKQQKSSLTLKYHNNANVPLKAVSHY